MARGLWVAPLQPIHIADGAAYASSATIADVSPTPNKLLAANQLQVGSVLRMRASGKFSNTGTPTLILGFYYGAVAGTALAASSAITTTTGATGWTWHLEYEGTVRTDGSSGTILSSFAILRIPTSLTAWTIRPLIETTPAAVTIDTTQSKALTVGATWGTSSSSNTLTCTHFSVELVT